MVAKSQTGCERIKQRPGEHEPACGFPSAYSQAPDNRLPRDSSTCGCVPTRKRIHSGLFIHAGDEFEFLPARLDKELFALARDLFGVFRGNPSRMPGDGLLPASLPFGPIRQGLCRVKGLSQGSLPSRLWKDTKYWIGGEARFFHESFHRFKHWWR